MSRRCATISEFAKSARESWETSAMTRVLVADASILAAAHRSAPDTVPPRWAGFARFKTGGTGLTMSKVWADLVVSVAVTWSAPELEATYVTAPAYSDIHCCPSGTARTVVRLFIAEPFDVNRVSELNQCRKHHNADYRRHHVQYQCPRAIKHAQHTEQQRDALRSLTGCSIS